MTISAVGYDGTVSEAQWAQIMHLAGIEYAVNGATDFLPVGSATRLVTCSVGTAYGNGVLATNSAADANARVTLPAPAAATGQWHLIVLRRDWAANTAVVTAIPYGATTADVAPTAPPIALGGLPTKGTAGGANFTGNPGVLDDQPLAWAHARAGNTTPVIYDLRARAITALPDPQTLLGPATIRSVAAATGIYADYPTDVMTLSIDLPRPCWVNVGYGLRSGGGAGTTLTGNAALVDFKLTGATTRAAVDDTALMLPQSGPYFKGKQDWPMLLNAGVTVVTLQVARSDGALTQQVRSPQLSLTPIKWAA